MTSEPPAAKRGAFITLEGVEGVGKSTNLAFVGDWLRQAGKPVLLTREPGGVAVAERIREILLASDATPMPPLTELLLMFAARSAHLAGRVWPALEHGEWVVCDRFTDASYAYQGGGRLLPEQVIATLEATVQGDFRPDLTLLLDASWQGTRARRDSRGTADRFELEGQAFFDRVRRTYLERAQREPGRIRIIDAEADLAGVQAAIARELAAFTACFT
ncbi:MAG: dTMP kinase [Gammaproteobacteria bacterium]|nr:dTMP kinase [Gammaproteobacteria bacterium]